MKEDFISRISNLTLFGYYDISKDLVVVHFFNKDEDKPDVVAFLKRNMSWDVREITGEKATLFPDKEIVEITYNQIDTFDKGSKFDQMIRNSLTKMVSQSEHNMPLREQNKMFRILEDCKYDD